MFLEMPWNTIGPFYQIWRWFTATKHNRYCQFENTKMHLPILAQFLLVEKIENSENAAPKGERPIEFDKKCWGFCRNCQKHTSNRNDWRGLLKMSLNWRRHLHNWIELHFNKMMLALSIVRFCLFYKNMIYSWLGFNRLNLQSLWTFCSNKDAQLKNKNVRFWTLCAIWS